MKLHQKGNRRLLVLGAVIITVLVVEVAVLLALTIAYAKDNKIASLKKSAEVQRVLSEIEKEEVTGLFFSMFPLDSYEEEDFNTYRGIYAAILDKELESGEEMLAFLELALQQKQSLELVYIGLSPDDMQEEDLCKWDDKLLEIVKANPQIYFHMILEQPSAYELTQMPELEREQLFKWYKELSELFTPEGEYQNMVLFAPGTESWLIENPANYLETGEPNKDVASAVLRRFACDYLHILDKNNADSKISSLQKLLEENEAYPSIEEAGTYVFFGDSVIGNYTDSMSIPGVVQGFSKARVINCGYGGLHGARTVDESMSLTSVIDAFLVGEYEHFEDDKPVKKGIATFYEQLSDIKEEKLTFFISIGLNDYMSGRPLTGDKEEERFHFEGALTYAVNELRKAYPDSEIILMTPNFISRYECGTELHNGYMLKDVVDCVLKTSDALDVKCIDVFHKVEINKENQQKYLADMCHPNEQGRFEIGKVVYEHLLEWHKGTTPMAYEYGALADKAENLENNIFFDSLVYTGYNIEKHRSDGLMWHYVLAAHKRGKGWLSDITYNGGSEGYEVTEDGLPDIDFFEKKGLVCASYATYVYFNYLPNVANVDTSELTRPEQSYNANDWYLAAKDWVDKGYSETIDFEAALKGGYIDFEAAEEIPIGSIIAFCDARNKSDYCSHVVIYAGYENDYHWVFHVGNENGPEFCAVERMHFGPDPQWPIAVITTPIQVFQH